MIWSAAPLAELLADRVFECPPGLDLVDGPWGLQLVATRSYAPGDVLYRAQWFVVEDVPHSFATTVSTGSGPRSVEVSNRNSVRFDGARVFDVPGCFMNHSCDPTTDSRYCEGSSDHYEQYAVREIAAGDEITCDYMLFDWDCHGHVFDCACGAADCYGRIAGFGSLDPQVQRALLPKSTDESLRRWRELHGDPAQ